MTYLAIWLYLWGWVMCAGLNASIGDDNKPHWLGAAAWPIVFPFVIIRRLSSRIN